MDLASPPFEAFKKHRVTWSLENYYVNPGPIQFYGPIADRITHTLNLENGGRFELSPPILPSTTVPKLYSKL